MKYFTSLFILLSIPCLLHGQDASERGNLHDYYQNRLNFGFAISYNQSNLVLDFNNNFINSDSMKSIHVITQPGFNLGVISEYALHKHLTIRFTPSISFAGRNIKYTVDGVDGETVYTKKLESNYLLFPVNLKFRSKRLHNFGAYFLTGGAYSLDLAAKKNQKEEITPVLSKQVLKLKRDDFSYEVGAGTEFYLMYFKFAVEAKINMGLRNMLINDRTIFSNPIKKLQAQMFIISITFEG